MVHRSGPIVQMNVFQPENLHRNMNIGDDNWFKTSEKQSKKKYIIYPAF